MARSLSASPNQRASARVNAQLGAEVMDGQGLGWPAGPVIGAQIAPDVFLQAHGPLGSA